MIKKPVVGCARLASRRLVLVTGPDSAEFMNGMISKSIYIPAKKAHMFRPHLGFYTGLFSPQGRILFDTFVYPIHLHNGWRAWVQRFFPANKMSKFHWGCLVDVDAGQEETLRMHLSRYKVRSQVNILPVDKDLLDVWYAFPITGISPSSPKALEEAAYTFGDIDNFSLSEGCDLDMRVKPHQSNFPPLCIPDPRLNWLGFRFLFQNRGDAASYYNHVEMKMAHVLGIKKDDLYRLEEEHYTQYRHSFGIPEGAEELRPTVSIPHENNLDYMDAIDFTKGCYLGQELTIRTEHTGIVRKRLMPMVLYKPGELIPREIPPFTFEALDKRIRNKENTSDPIRSSSSSSSPSPDTGSESEVGPVKPPRGAALYLVGGKRRRDVGKWVAGPAGSGSSVGLGIARLEATTTVRVAPEVPSTFSLADEFELNWNEMPEDMDEDEEPALGQARSIRAAVIPPSWFFKKVAQAKKDKATKKAKGKE